MNVVQIIYASTSGNVEYVCEEISKVLTKNKISNVLTRAETASTEIITNNSLFVLATSTWEHGELNPFFNNLYKFIKTADLTNKAAIFVGLGDTRYEPVLFCGGMEELKKAFLESKGTALYNALKINGEPYHQINTVLKWAEELSVFIKQNKLIAE